MRSGDNNPAKAMTETSFSCHGRKLAALASGGPPGTPLLALHGWLDNAESFAPLAAQLPGFHLVALDLAGHGRSDHRGADGEYNIWSDLPDIAAVSAQLGWRQFHLIGHSRGAIVAALAACAMPQRMLSLIMLDAFPSPGAAAGDMPRQLGNYVADKLHLFERPGRRCQSVEEAIALRQKEGMVSSSFRRLAERNLRRTESGQWEWRTDPRVKGASAFKLTAAHNAALAAALKMPTLLLLAEDGIARQGFANSALAGQRAVQMEVLPGSHHFHMETAVTEVAERVRLWCSGEQMSCVG